MRSRLTRFPRTLAEEAAVVAVAVGVTIHAEWNLLFERGVYQPDALFQEYWMRQFRDPALFTDQLTADLRATGYFPRGLEFVHWLAAHVIDPVTFAAWLPVALVPLCAWMVFRCIRIQTDWAPAAWLGSLLFLAPVDILRFSGGHSRAFAQVILIGALYLMLAGRPRLAALVPPLGMLFYPPAALGALAMIGLSALARRLDRERIVLTAASAATAAAIALLIGSGDLISESEAMRYPEFNAHGQFPFFGHTLLGTLTRNYSGFNLAVSGSILAVGALVVIALSPSVLRLVRTEVWALAAGGLILFGLAHATLFRLYLPNRYTYALVPVYCIVIAVGWKPLWDRAVRLPVWPLAAVAVPAAVVVLAWTTFPLGRQAPMGQVTDWAGDSAVLLFLPAAVAALAVALVHRTAVVLAAVVAAALLISSAAVAGESSSAQTNCPTGRLMAEIARLPVNAVIAGDPHHLSCVPMVTRHPVVISEKLYQPLAKPYFEVIRPRMFDMVRAYWGPTLEPLKRLRDRYGADYLVVRPLGKEPWKNREPFTSLKEELLRNPAGPAVQRLGDRCLVWRAGHDRIYDLACLTR